MNLHESSSVAGNSVKAGEVCVLRKDDKKLFHGKFTSGKPRISVTQFIVSQSHTSYRIHH